MIRPHSTILKIKKRPIERAVVEGGGGRGRGERVSGISTEKKEEGWEEKKNVLALLFFFCRSVQREEGKKERR